MSLAKCVSRMSSNALGWQQHAGQVVWIEEDGNTLVVVLLAEIPATEQRKTGGLIPSSSSSAGHLAGCQLAVGSWQ